MASPNEHLFIRDNVVLRLNRGEKASFLVDLICSGTDEATLAALGMYDSTPFFRELIENGMLVDSSTDFCEPQIWKHQLGFLSEFTRTPSLAQKRLRDAKVAVIGIGGIGSVVVQNLVGAGIGRLHIVDGDLVALDNLNRQFCYCQADIGQPKVKALSNYVAARTTETDVSYFQGQVRSRAELEAALKGLNPQIIVLAADQHVNTLEMAVAGHCASSNCALVSAAVGLHSGYWGPLLWPGTTGCLSCFNSARDRRLTPEELNLLDQVERAGQASFGPTNTVVASHLAHDIILFLAACGPVRSMGRRLYLRFDSLEVETLEAPLCSCGAWKTTEPRLDASSAHTIAIDVPLKKPNGDLSVETRSRDYVVVEIDALPVSLAHGYAIDHIGDCIASLIRKRLFGPALGSASVKPELAENAWATNNARTWYVRMNSNQYWSDGSRITAADVKRAFDRHINNNVSPLSWLIRYLLGECDACVVLDNETVRFDLTLGMVSFPTLLTNDFCSPIHSATGAESDPKCEPTCGSFEIAKFLPDSRGIVLFPSARTTETADRNKSLIFLRTDNPEQGVRLYKNGLLDMTCITWFSPSVLGNIVHHEDVFFSDLALCGQLEFGAGCGLSLNIQHVIARCLDRDDIVSALGEFAKPIYLLTDLWKDDSLRCSPTVEPKPRSRWESEARGSFWLSFADFPPNEIIAKWIAERIMTCTDLKVQLAPLSYAEYVATSLSGEYDLRLNLVAPLFDDPSSVPLACKRRLEGNDVRIDDRTAFDTLLSAALAAEHFDDRLRLSRKAEICSWDYAFSIPLFQLRSVVLKRDTLGSVQIHRSGILDFSGPIAS